MHRQQALFPEIETSIRLAQLKKLKPERLPTNTTTASHPVHRWFNFIAGFSPELVELLLEETPGQSNSGPMLDPFAGCGTAPLAASVRGVQAFGYEPHPVFRRICQAKLPEPDSVSRLAAVKNAIAIGLRNPVPITELGDAPGKFLVKLFPVEVLTQLLGAREKLTSAGLSSDPLAFLFLSKLLDLSSHSATDGIYKAPTTKKRALKPAQAMAFVHDMIYEDLARVGHLDIASRVSIHEKSSEQMSEISDNSIAIVVTSPPYLNNFDYAEMTRMYLYFWGLASSWSDITEKVRSRLIVNTTTALKGHRKLQDIYREEISSTLYGSLDSMVQRLSERRTQKAGKKEYHLLVYPYFAQITRVFRECIRVTRPGAPIHVMIADAALYGVHIRTPQILASILEDIGFRNVSCTLVRRRGHRWVLDKREGAKEGLGEYHVRATR